MPFRTAPLLALPAAALCLSACERKPPEPRPVQVSSPAPPIPPSPAAAAAASAAQPTDARTDPDRMLRTYADALHARDWAKAAEAWSAGSGVTAAILRAAYDRSEPPTLEIGKGEVEGAAGSLYYEAPVVLRFGSGEAGERGTLTLRRVNDVPGATPEQRRWHIERATIGVGQ